MSTAFKQFALFDGLLIHAAFVEPVWRILSRFFGKWITDLDVIYKIPESIIPLEKQVVTERFTEGAHFCFFDNQINFEMNCIN